MEKEGLLERFVGWLFGMPYLRELGYDIDFDRIVLEKRQYNANRADHKIENRKSVGGKAF